MSKILRGKSKMAKKKQNNLNPKSRNPNKAKAPKARISIPVKQLQNLLFLNSKMPDVFPSFKCSPELMKIYKILIDSPKTWENSLEYELDPLSKLDLVFGIGHRHIFTYRCYQDFYLNVGELSDQTIPRLPEEIKLARWVQKGDTILIRYDDRDENQVVDVQILTSGLMQDDSEDWKQFTMDTVDLKQIRPYLKLLDKKDIYEQQDEPDQSGELPTSNH